MLLRLWPIVGGLSLGLLMAGPLLAYSQIARPLTGFMIFAASLIPGLIALIIGLILLFGFGDRGHHVFSGVASMLFGCLPFLVIIPGVIKGSKLPTINDVTTDVMNPPVLTEAAKAPEHAGVDLSFPDTFKELVKQSYPHVATLTLQEDAAAVFAKTEAALASMPEVRITRRDPAAGVLEGHAVTGLFKFVDDFAVRINSTEHGTTWDMRSRSRVGKGDFGVNAARIDAVMNQVNNKH